jgi:hypothetical protein
MHYRRHAQEVVSQKIGGQLLDRYSGVQINWIKVSFCVFWFSPDTEN